MVLKFPFHDARGRRLLAGVSMNVTDRKDAEAALLAKQEVLKQLYESQENERRLVAFELHDGPIQYVTAALLHLDALRASLPDKPVEMELALHLLRKALEDSRRLMNGIRPPVLDESGLIPAIEQLIAQETSESCKIEFVHDGEVSRFAPSLESAIYRIVQEGLTNARKHSGSEVVRITLAESDRRIRLEIQDWGAGFDPANVAGHRGGLKGFAERVRLAGGDLKIDASPGKGTRIVVELPMLQPV
jgi:signal transduction histidine kinase